MSQERNWTGIHLGKLLPCTHPDELGFVGIQLPPVRCHPSLDPSLCASLVRHMHSFQTSWFTATICLQASQTPSFGSYSQCCMSLYDSEVRSYFWNHPWPASMAVCSTPNRLQVRNSGLHVLAHCTMGLLPILSDGYGAIPVSHNSGGVCFVHLQDSIQCLLSRDVRNSGPRHPGN